VEEEAETSTCSAVQSIPVDFALQAQCHASDAGAVPHCNNKKKLQLSKDQIKRITRETTDPTLKYQQFNYFCI
jgi:hypothetical protein